MAECTICGGFFQSFRQGLSINYSVVFFKIPIPLCEQCAVVFMINLKRFTEGLLIALLLLEDIDIEWGLKKFSLCLNSKSLREKREDGKTKTQ